MQKRWLEEKVEIMNFQMDIHIQQGVMYKLVDLKDVKLKL